MHRSEATLIAIALTLGVALPAAAAAIGPVVDASDDVWVIDFQSAEEEARPDQRVPDTDVRRLSAADPVDTGRGSSTVSLTLELAAAPHPDAIVMWVFGAEGSTDVQADLRYGVLVAGTTGEHSFARVDDPQGGGLEFGCPGSTHRWTTATTLEVTFDSACIRAPRSLPTAARVFSFTDTAFRFDLAPNARNRSELRSGWAEPDQPPAFTLALPGSGTGLSPTARDASRTCEGARSGRFPDTRGNLHEANIDCAAHRGITSGTRDGRYAPDERLRRDQIATFIVNTLREAGVALPSSVPDYFSDDDGSVHEANINTVAHLGIMRGEGSRFLPGALVTRATMADAVANALDVHHPQGELAADYFTDDDGLPEEPAIGRVAQEGVVTGKGSGPFAPGETLRRDQMATFLVRLLDAVS